MYFTLMNILIRLHNWLGDMVISTAFVQAVKDQFPSATIDLIAKNKIDFLLDFFPAHEQRFIFSKEEYNGIEGARKFGEMIRKQKKYDLFFSLPDSFSAAIMGYAIAAKERIGYKKELRSVFLTQAFRKKKNTHRVEEYIDLLQQYLKKEIIIPSVKLHIDSLKKKETLIININSEASSRRLPKEKAISIIDAIRNRIKNEIILVGSEKEKDFVTEVYNELDDNTNIINKAGNTSLPEMVALLSSCSVMLTTDSGPAHVANAVGVYTIVLFGAGNENNTAPYNADNRKILRLGKLPCEPCISNTCKHYGIPKCLQELDESLIISTVLAVLN